MAQAVPTVAEYLQEIRLRLLGSARTRAAWAGLAALAAIAWLIPLLGSTAISPTLIRLGLGLGVVLIGAALALWGVFLPRAQYLRDERVALEVTRHAPALRSELVSAVELARDAGHGSSALVAAHADTTARALASVPASRVVPPVRAHWLWLLSLALLVAHTAWAVKNWAEYRHSWTVLIRPANPMASAKRVSQRLISDLVVQIEPPAYTGRPKLELPASAGDFRALAGSAIDLELSIETNPAKAGLWVVEEATAPYALPLVRRGQRWGVSWNLVASAHYQFWLETADGSRTLEATPRRIDAEPDLVPTVALEAPADELEATNLRRVELGFSADDDFAITQLELIWQNGTRVERVPLPMTGERRASVRGRWLWDLAHIAVTPGSSITYWIEARDNQEPVQQVGRSRSLVVRIVSERQQHELLLGRLRTLTVQLLDALAARLVESQDLATRLADNRTLATLIADAGGLAGSFDRDRHAQPAVARVLTALTTQLGRHSKLEATWLDTKPSPPFSRNAAGAQRIIAELEDGILRLADLLERERLEEVLGAADEAGTRSARLRELLAEYARDPRPELAVEIDRELAAIAQNLADVAAQKAQLGDDVIDAFMNQGALDELSVSACFTEVRTHMAAGLGAEALAVADRCAALLANAQGSLAQSLDAMSSARFTEEQRLFEALLGELADVRKAQEELASTADDLFLGYAAKADAVVRSMGRDARLQLSDLLERARRRAVAIEPTSLTQLGVEEVGVAVKRFADAAQMLKEGDLTEASAMVRQAVASIGAAQDDLGDVKKSDLAQDAANGLERAERAAHDLLEAIDAFAPEPRDVYSDAELRAVDRLRARQAVVRGKARALAARVTKERLILPGDAAAVLSEKLGTAMARMVAAESRARLLDPGQLAYETKQAALALQQAAAGARGAARQQLAHSPSENEPLRIPNADAFTPPKEFRSELLEGMKRSAPHGYAESVRQYYEELAR